jgi:hypothetical protein
MDVLDRHVIRGSAVRITGVERPVGRWGVNMLRKVVGNYRVAVETAAVVGAWS